MAQSFTSVIMQETEGDGQSSGSQSPETPSLAVKNVFGREFRLICPICLQDLKRPRQLMNCYHIFCSDCIRPSIEKATDGPVHCPLDKCKMTSERHEVSDALNSDTYIHTFQGQVMMYAESGSLSCDDPSHDNPVPSLYYCLECKCNFCDGCYGNHNGNEEFKGHHCLRLFQCPSTMTVGMNRASARPTGAAAMGDGLDAGSPFKCPIERNTDKCEHEQWLHDLHDDQFLTNNQCPILEHAPDNTLIAFCNVCQEPICAKCSMIEHRDHTTINISRAKEDKLFELRCLKKELDFKREIFYAAYQAADKAVDIFEHHINQTEQEMIRRKGEVLVKVEESFKVAHGLIDQTGQKQAKISRQSKEMLEEANFLKLATELADKMSEQATPPLAVVRAWKGLDLILKTLLGQTEKGKSSSVEPSEDILPQCIVEKRLVLPAPNCLTPDLGILRKVGVEGTVLKKSFDVLPADDELLLFYSILPLTATEALVSCKTNSHTSSVVQYSSLDQDHHSVLLPLDGQYSIVAVPGNGIVATLYQAAASSSKREVLFWDQALDRSLKEHEAQNAVNNLKPFATTTLPPRGLAVTRDNHLVICTADDPPKGKGESGGRNCIVLMTMKGDVIGSNVMDSGPAPNNSQYFPRYVTVNINDDVCVTDFKQQAIHILNRDLDPINKIKNPYDKDSLNENFSPMGICHDSFGRLIVADSDNHCVLRFVVGEVAGSQQVEVILKDKQDGVKDLSYPTLVALGPGPRLWVVCRSNIHVFDYMDEERAA